MAKEISIIFNEDGKLWAEYLQEQLTNTLNVTVFLQLDTVLFGSLADVRSQTRILKSGVVIVIVTPGHMDLLLKKNAISYDKFIQNSEKAILFLAGLSEEEIHEDCIRLETRRIFINYDNWAKVKYTDETSIKILKDKTAEILERPDSILSDFSLVPSTVHCEEETTVAVLIDTAIPGSADVCAVVRGTYFDAVLPCQRANPYTYTFVMPRHIEDEVTVTIKINKQSLGSQAKLSYKSYIRCSDQTAITEIYCYMLNQLCTYVMTKMNKSDVNHEIDQQLSAVFDYIVDLPAVGYEKLFGIYQYLNEEHSRRKIPNLVHLGANHNLRELVDHLGKLPHFFIASCISNSEEKTPEQTAESLGFTDLSELLKRTKEQTEMYYEMADYTQQSEYVQLGSGPSDETVDPDGCDNKKSTKIPVVDDMYMDMSSNKTPTLSQSSGFYLGKASSETSHLTVLGESRGYKDRSRQTQVTWRRNSDRSSGASTASRSSSSSFLSGHASVTSCSSGIEEDFETRTDRHKWSNERSLPEPPSLPVLETHPEAEETLDSVPLEAPPPIPVRPMPDQAPSVADRIQQPGKQTAKTGFRLKSINKTAKSSKPSPN